MLEEIRFYGSKNVSHEQKQSLKSLGRRTPQMIARQAAHNNTAQPPALAVPSTV